MFRLKLFSITASIAGALIGLALFPLDSAAGGVSTIKTGNSGPGAPQSCHRPFEAYAVSKSFLIRCGDQIFPLRHIERLPGGGKAYIYDVNGVRSVTRTPPPGFNPLTASASRLVEYGYPPKPSGGQALRSWRTIVHNAHFITPPKYMVGIPERLTPRQLPVLHPNRIPGYKVYDNPIWAGNMATTHTYRDVYANWLEPSTHINYCSSPNSEGMWVGLGGANTSTLAQAGTAVGIHPNGLNDHQAWYELINGSTNVFATLPVTATVGGEFTSEVDRVSGGYYIFVKNDYTGASWNGTPGFSPYDGSTAEAIVEDPAGGVANGMRLRDFDPFKVEDAEASENGSTYHGLAYFDHDDMVMVYNGDQLAHAGSASNSGDTWTDYHDHCS